MINYWEIVNKSMVEATSRGFPPLARIVETIERNAILVALDKARWSKTRAGAILGIKRTTLVMQMKALGIPLDPADGRKALKPGAH